MGGSRIIEAGASIYVPRVADPSGKDVEPSCKRKNESAKHNFLLKMKWVVLMGMRKRVGRHRCTQAECP